MTIVVTWIAPWEPSTILLWSIILTVSHYPCSLYWRDVTEVVWIQLLQVAVMDLFSQSLPSCSPPLSSSPSLSLSNPDEQMGGGEGEKKTGHGSLLRRYNTVNQSPPPQLSPPAPFPSCSFLSCQHFSQLYLNLLSPHTLSFIIMSLYLHHQTWWSTGLLVQTTKYFLHEKKPCTPTWKRCVGSSAIKVWQSCPEGHTDTQ